MAPPGSRNGHPRRVLMASPPVSGAGGMASVAHNIVTGLDRSHSRYRVHMLDSGGGTGRAGYVRFGPAVQATLTSTYDLLHLHVAMRGSTLRKAMLAAAAASRGRPYVIHLHGSSYDRYVRGLSGVHLRLVRRFFASAAAVIVLGEHWRRLVVEELQVPDERTHVVYNGVPAITPPPQQQPRDPRTVLFLGVVTRRKGVDLLLSAWQTLGRRGVLPGWRLVLAGPAPEPDLLDAVSATAAACSGGDVVHVGPVFGADRDRLVGEADVFVLPSRAEAMPMSILEAMSVGVPCLATRVGSVAEVLRTPDDGGLLVDPDDVPALTDALERLLVDDELRNRLGRHANRRWRETFTVESMAETVADVWDAVLEDAPART